MLLLLEGTEDCEVRNGGRDELIGCRVPSRFVSPPLSLNCFKKENYETSVNGTISSEILSMNLLTSPLSTSANESFLTASKK